MSLSGMPAEENFARAYTIGNDGFVNIPYAGQVRAAGLTQSQLERAIEQRFVEGKIYRWPTVTINVQSGARYVTIGGSVRAPQRMVWAADLTLSGAVMAAGGAGDFGGDKVNLIRSGNRSTYSLKKIRANPADDPRLFPGDQVELVSGLFRSDQLAVFP
jgi:polysaccharide export outer membrane protein